MNTRSGRLSVIIAYDVTWQRIVVLRNVANSDTPSFRELMAKSRYTVRSHLVQRRVGSISEADRPGAGISIQRFVYSAIIGPFKYRSINVMGY